jgi:hypothetical protein
LGSGIFFGNWVGGQFGPNEGREHALLAEDSLVGQGPLGRRRGVAPDRRRDRVGREVLNLQPDQAHQLDAVAPRDHAFSQAEVDRDAYFSPFIWSEGFRTFVKRFYA